MIYLDNAATTWPKPAAVLKEMTRCMKYFGANPGRGGHKAALKAAEEVFKCRCAVADMVNLENPENVIFTSNATHALNIAIKGTVKKGGHVIITSMEHNSVLRPVHACGVSYSVAPADIFGYVKKEAVEELIQDNTCLIVCTLASNVCGSAEPFEDVACVAKRRSIPFLLDASQGMGAIEIDMQKSGIDMLAAPGHKGLYGPMGTGILCVRNCVPTPLMQGGTGSSSKSAKQPLELPDMLESGTLNVPGIVGLKCGIDFVKRIGIKELNYRENRLADILAQDLSVIKNISLAGYDKRRERIGVLSVCVNGADCVSLASQLSEKYNIAARAGFHCAYDAHKSLGTSESGTIRFSLGAFNTLADVKKTAFAMSRLV